MSLVARISSLVLIAMIGPARLDAQQQDPKKVERGKYLLWGAGGCNDCS
jgi:hypothetical protein